MNVDIVIRYNGKYRAKAGVQSEELAVSENVEEAYRFIMDHLQQNHGIEPPFLLMVRNMHVIGAVKKNIRLTNGDVFQVLPFMSGG